MSNIELEQQAPVAPLGTTAQEVYHTYHRQYRLRLAHRIALFLEIALAIITILGTALNVVRGVFITKPLQAVLFTGMGLVLYALLWLGDWCSHRQKMLWATSLVTGATVLGTSLLSIFANYIVITVHVNTQLGFLSLTIGIIVAGLLGTVWWVVSTAIFLNIFSFAAMFLILPALLHQQFTESVPLAVVIITVQWVVAAIVIVGQMNYEQTIRELSDAKVAFVQAQQLDELKDQFISSVNHELRNPLMAMMNYVTILRQRHDRMTPERRAQALEALEGTGKRVVQLVGSILDVRQIAEHSDDFVPIAVPVKATYLTATTLLDPSEARLNEREVVVNVPDQLTVWGNEVYLQQILTNLLSNALKYSAADTSITIEAQVVTQPFPGRSKADRSRRMVDIVVRDQGYGIPPDQIPLLFNRFVRLPRDLTSSTVGNGLGLYLCKVLTEAMGGTIWVESSGIEGEGAAFHVVLPQDATAVVDDALPITQKRFAVMRARRQARAVRVAIAAVLVSLIGGLLIVQYHPPTPPAPPAATGNAHFMDANGGSSNGVQLDIANLASPAAGAHYEAWLIDPVKEQIIDLGSLLKQGHDYALTYAGSAQSDNLLGLGSEIEITQARGSSTAPLGKVLLSGNFPPKAFIHIRHLLFDFPATPNNKGLLVGLVEQTQLLDQQAHQLQQLGAQNPLLSRCLKLNMLAIVEGQHGQHYQPLPNACQGAHIVSGDGYGLLAPPAATKGGGGYVDGATAHMALTLQQADATPAMRDPGDKVVSSLAMLKTTATAFDAALVNSIPTATDAQLAALVTSADAMYMGDAAASTATPAGTAGGALYTYTEGQLIADLPLR